MKEMWASTSEEVFGIKVGDVSEGHEFTPDDVLAALQSGVEVEEVGESVFLCFADWVDVRSLIDVDWMIDQMEEQLGELAGEIAEGWDTPNTKQRERLAEVIALWFEKSDTAPRMFQAADTAEFFVTKDQFTQVYAIPDETA